MTLSEARKEAEKPVENGLIPFVFADTSKNLIGKILTIKKTGGQIHIIEQITHNYVIQRDGKYGVAPVMYIINKIDQFIY